LDKDYKKFEETADFIKGIAHPVRICILKGLVDNGGCNVTDMVSCLGLPQSTISTHLSRLRSFGAVMTERRGTEIYYTIGDERISNLLKAIGVNHE